MIRKLQYNSIEVIKMFMHTNLVNACQKPYISLHEEIYFYNKNLDSPVLNFCIILSLY